MARQTVNYSLIPDLKARKAKALEDCQTYMGLQQFNHFVSMARQLHHTPPPLRSIAFPLAFLVGVEGYPAEVLYEHIFGQEAKDKDLRIKLVDASTGEELGYA